MNLLGRTALRSLALALIVTIIYCLLILGGYVSFGNSADGVSSATVIASMDDIEGKYVVYINRERHKDTLDEWIKFFKGEDVGFIMEDIVCTVASSDSEGIETAETYRSRLPENQMTVKPETGVMAVSKAESGVFDIMIMSAFAAKAYGADETLKNNSIEDLTLGGKNEKI